MTRSASHARSPVRRLLRDGSTIILRPIQQDDRERLLAAFEHLGRDSRYSRFLSPHDRLSDKELRYFTDVDHDRHEAIIGLDAVTGDGIGVARYIVSPADPETAEMAVAVVDEWQARGVGTVLLAALLDRARASGVRHFTAFVLNTNAPMISMLEGMGEVRRASRQGSASEFAIDLKG